MVRGKRPKVVDGPNSWPRASRRSSTGKYDPFSSVPRESREQVLDGIGVGGGEIADL